MDDSKGLPYFLLGLGVGVAVGMVFAPKAGAETRTLIRTRANESGDYIRRRGTELRDSASGIIDKGKDAVTRQRQQLNSAMEAGKQAYRDTVGGGSPASDLQTNPPVEGI